MGDAVRGEAGRFEEGGRRTDRRGIEGARCSTEQGGVGVDVGLGGRHMGVWGGVTIVLTESGRAGRTTGGHVGESIECEAYVPRARFAPSLRSTVN